MGIENNRLKAEGVSKRKQRAANKLQKEASQTVQPAVEALKRYGNVAIGVMPGASEVRFTANLMAHYARKDQEQGISTKFVELSAWGAVRGKPMQDRSAKSIISTLAHYTREPEAGKHRAVIVVRDVEHSPLRTAGSERGHDFLREGLSKLARYEAVFDHQPLEPAVVAIGGISSQAVDGSGLLRRYVSGEEFIDSFYSHMLLQEGGSLTPYTIHPTNTTLAEPEEIPVLPYAKRSEGPLSIPIEYGGPKLGA